MADAELEEVDLDAAEAAWEEAERLTLEAAEAEAEAEARELKLRAELEAELARALLVAEEARQRARRAEHVAAKLRRRAARAWQPDEGKKRDEIQQLSKAADRKATRAVKREADARRAAEAAAEALLHATPPLSARHKAILSTRMRAAQAEKRMKAGARRRKRDKKKSEALQKKRHEAWVARCERLKGRSRRLHLGDVVGRHERIKKAEQERAAHARRNGLRVRAATAELVARAAMDASVKAVQFMERAVAAVHAADRSKDRADRRRDRREAASAAASALRAISQRQRAAKKVVNPLSKSKPLRVQICYLSEPRAAIDATVPAAWADAPVKRLLMGFRKGYAAQTSCELPERAELFTLKGGVSLAGETVREAVALADGMIEVRVSS